MYDRLVTFIISADSAEHSSMSICILTMHEFDHEAIAVL